MAQLSIKFGDVPYASPYYSIGREECINLYVEKAISEHSKYPYYFVSIPGLRRFVTADANEPCRNIFRTSNNRLFGVFSNKLYEISSAGAKTFRGTITTYSGTVNFADNTQQMILVDGEYGYIFDFTTNNFSKIDTNQFPNGATHVSCIDTYFLVNKPNSIYYYWSSPNNGLEWNELDFASKEGMPDDVVAIKECNSQLWVFGSYSTEIHYNTGDIETQLWQRYMSSVIDIGCTAKYSLARIENRIFWLGTDKTGNVAAWTNDTTMPLKISTRGIEQLILAETGGNVSNAVGFSYSQAGHSFWVLQFLSSALTLVYDLSTQTWHRRQERLSTGEEARWQGMYSTFSNGQNIFADFDTNALYVADVEYYQNDRAYSGQGYIHRIRTTPIQHSQQKRVRWNSLQVIFEQGSGLNQDNVVGFGKQPVCILEVSDDSGKSYGNRRTAEIGAIGDYTKRTRFVNLGISRNRVYKISITDPVKIILVGLVADFQELLS